MTTISLSYRAVGRKIASMALPRINWKIFHLFAALLALFMLIFYVYSVNKITGNIALVKDYNQQIDLLLKENSALQADLEQVGFWGKIMEQAKELSFEKTSNIKYLQIPVTDSSLAKASSNVE